VHTNAEADLVLEIKLPVFTANHVGVQFSLVCKGKDFRAWQNEAAGSQGGHKGQESAQKGWNHAWSERRVWVRCKK